MRTQSYKSVEFSPEQYERCNDFGISIIEDYLRSRDYIIHEKEEEDYDIDITSEKDGVIFKYEAEVKTRYSFTSKEDYRFDTVSFLGRKKKYHDNNAEGFYYCIVCAETKCILYCHSSKIYKESYKVVLNINTDYREGTDVFYLVPKEDCSFINISEQ